MNLKKIKNANIWKELHIRYQKLDDTYKGDGQCKDDFYSVQEIDQHQFGWWIDRENNFIATRVRIDSNDGSPDENKTRNNDLLEEYVMVLEEHYPDLELTNAGQNSYSEITVIFDCTDEDEETVYEWVTNTMFEFKERILALIEQID